MLDSYVEYIRSLIGSPPVGYEYLEYFVLAGVMFFSLWAIYFLLVSIFKLFGGGR